MSTTFIAVLILILGSSIMVISGDWRLRLLALFVQYASTAALMALEVLPALGGVRLLAGVIVVIILLQSVRHVRAEKAEDGKPELSSPGSFLSLTCVLLAIIISFGLAQSYPLPSFPRDITIAVYWLILCSSSSLILSRDVVRIGFALLTLELAAALVAGIMVEEANLARFLLASLSSIVLALAVAYLIGLDRGAAESNEVER